MVELAEKTEVAHGQGWERNFDDKEMAVLGSMIRLADHFEKTPIKKMFGFGKDKTEHIISDYNLLYPNTKVPGNSKGAICFPLAAILGKHNFPYAAIASVLCKVSKGQCDNLAIQFSGCNADEEVLQEVLRTYYTVRSAKANAKIEGTPCKIYLRLPSVAKRVFGNSSKKTNRIIPDFI